MNKYDIIIDSGHEAMYTKEGLTVVTDCNSCGLPETVFYQKKIFS